MKEFKGSLFSLILLSVLLFALPFFLGGCGFLGQSPTARISTSPSAEDGTVTVQVGDKITFDAGDSEANGGEITEYTWNFGDDSTASGETKDHSYDSAGSYTVELTVTDDNGSTDTASVEVEVKEELNASIKVTSPSDPDSVNVGDEVTFDASDSTGDITSYEWDFKSASDPGSATDSGETASYTYDSAGSYTVELVVTGSNGATDKETYSIGVSSDNEPPTAVIEAEPTGGVESVEVDFDGSGSSDPDGNIESYSWDFDDGEESSKVSPTHTFTNDTDSPVEYIVTLTVTDDDGASDTAEQIIEVEVVPPPPS